MKDYNSCEDYLKLKETHKNQNVRCMYETPSVEEMEMAEAGMICIRCDFKKFVDMANEVQERAENYLKSGSKVAVSKIKTMLKL